MIEQDHAVVGFERRRHEAPHVLVAPEAVGEDHRAAVPATRNLHVVALENAHSPGVYLRLSRSDMTPVC